MTVNQTDLNSVVTFSQDSADKDNRHKFIRAVWKEICNIFDEKFSSENIANKDTTSIYKCVHYYTSLHYTAADYAIAF